MSSDIVTVGNLIARGARRLSEADIPNSALDARLLLQHVLKCSHSQLIAAQNEELSQGIISGFWELIGRRLAKEPVHRIIGERDFYGRSFRLSGDTLIPRPDTEILVEEALRVLSRFEHRANVLEIGTGSGAIAVTLACEHEDVSVLATDVSKGALDTASGNATTHGVEERVEFLHADLFDGVERKFDMIVSNPPYIPTSDIGTLDDEVRLHDPILALNGGADGLDFYRKIFEASERFLCQQGALLVEFGLGQHCELDQMIRNCGFQSVSFVKDLSSIDRVLVAENFVSTG